MTAERLERLAELAVRVGANVQHGQIVSVETDVTQAELVRAISVAAYRAGARFVDVRYWDAQVKRARLLYADAETLTFVPAWYGDRLLALGDERAARIVITPNVAPGALDGVDPERSGRDALPFVKETLQIINENTVNWTIVPGPTEDWARRVHPDLEPGTALERLWDEIEHVCRLDADDPARAWEERVRGISRAADWLNERHFDALHFEGPGTDLTVGLFPSSLWQAAFDATTEGIRHLVNIPTEEVYTTPDPARAEGVVRSTKPLDLAGTLVRDFTVRFEGGRAVRIDAAEGAEALRARAARDADAGRLGEVALVDREGRIGRLDTVFYDTLLDENAASHIALGNAYEAGTTDPADTARANQSAIHIDFMIGSEDVAVTGITGGGERVPVLRKNVWQI